jgi:Na+/H+ antiporter NhaD/arsenite permease-like protein
MLTHAQPALSEPQIIAGYVIFIASYVVFAFGKFPGMKIDRPGAAIIGAVLMVAARVVTPAGALSAISFATIVLLGAMMLVVGNLRLAGFFERAGEFAVRHLGRQHLLPAVILTTGVLSAFFVNDIVCLVMVPFVLSTTRRLRLPPMRYLLAVATASNIGSVATITGNPQNMLIGSYSGISYRDFLVHLGPVAAGGLLLCWLVLHANRGIDRTASQPAWEHAQPDTPKSATAALSGDPDSGAAGPTRKRSPFAAGGLSSQTHEETRVSLGLLKPGLVALGVLAGFLAGLSPALVASVGAAVLLVTRSMEPKLVYEEVDWGLLVFFIGLFLIVAGAEQVGFTGKLLEVASAAGLNRSSTFAAATVVLSNIVSNVPAVMLLKSIVPSFANTHTAWLLLAMASTLAGNLTITGSVANIIVVERSKGEVPIGFWDYFRVGLPVTIVTLLFGWAWLLWVG